MNRSKLYLLSTGATFVLLFSDCSNKILPHQQPIYATRVFQLKWDNDSVKLKFNPHRAITAYNYNLGYRIERDIRIYYNESGLNLTRNQFL